MSYLSALIVTKDIDSYSLWNENGCSVETYSIFPNDIIYPWKGQLYRITKKRIIIKQNIGGWLVDGGVCVFDKYATQTRVIAFIDVLLIYRLTEDLAVEVMICNADQIVAHKRSAIPWNKLEALPGPDNHRFLANNVIIMKSSMVIFDPVDKDIVIRELPSRWPFISFGSNNLINFNGIIKSFNTDEFIKNVCFASDPSEIQISKFIGKLSNDTIKFLWSDSGVILMHSSCYSRIMAILMSRIECMPTELISLVMSYLPIVSPSPIMNKSPTFPSCLSS